MKRNDAEQIGDMIRKFFRLNGLESPLNEYRLVQAWKDVVGPAIAGYTSNLYIKNQILYVHLTSSVLRQELMMGRDLLVRNLNKQVGAQVIVNIILSITLSKIYGVFGVAMASTISSIVTAVLLFISTRRLVGNFDVVPMIIKLLKILLAAIMMLFVLVALNNVLNLDNKIIIILVNGTAGILIYSILCKILKIEEFNEAIDMIKNKVSKKAPRRKI